MTNNGAWFDGAFFMSSDDFAFDDEHPTMTPCYCRELCLVYRKDYERKQYPGTMNG